MTIPLFVMELKEPLFPPTPPLAADETCPNGAQFRHEHHKKSIPSRSILTSLVLLPLTLLAMMGHIILSRQSFDSELWKTASPVERATVRKQMSDDLINSHMLIGLNRVEVASLLGKPDWEDSTIHEMGYDTSQSAFDITLLRVRFDSNNYVTNCSIENIFF